jgi:antitoxin ParD1/3/4
MTVERITITLTADMAEDVRAAVQAGDYASSSEIVRDALREWRHSRLLRQNEIERLKRDIGLGLADIEAGRIHDYDPEKIVSKGKKQLKDRSNSE